MSARKKVSPIREKKLAGKTDVPTPSERGAPEYYAKDRKPRIGKPVSTP